MIKNNRISAIVSLTKGINTLLDIGCDHGLVIKEALDNNYIKQGIASDINVGPLNSAKTNLKGYPVKFVLSDGFLNINDNYDGVVIAGMGAHLICNILKNAPKDENITYILQPNGRYEILRKYLSENNFKIVNEILVYEKRYYVVLKVTRGKEKLTEQEIYLGPYLSKQSSSKEYYQMVLDKYYQVIKNSGIVEKEIKQKVLWLQGIIDKHTGE